MSKVIHSLGFSGGRTSAYMESLFRSGAAGLNDGLPHEAVFANTGAEDNLTYKFIRDCRDKGGSVITCLEADVNPQMGKSNDYKIVRLDDCKFDMGLIKMIAAKYGGFTNNRPYCTDKLKTIISTKYRDDTHGKGRYYTWLGIRFDEPKRLIGDHVQKERSAYKQLREQGFDDFDISVLFRDLCQSIDNLESRYSFLKDSTKKLLTERRGLQEKLGLRYLAEISDFSKQDVLNWWSKQPFDLQIEEHLGNCLFCIKKSDLKVALAARDRPEEFKLWDAALTSDAVREMPADKHGVGHIYRGWKTPQQLIGMFNDATTEELRQRVYKSKMDDSGSCSESCEAFGDLQLDLFDGEQQK